jgi:hypothetical protein
MKFLVSIALMLALLLTACSVQTEEQGASDNAITVYKSPT